ncbi:hypothetical protein KSP39_PZI011246 [Platanthera zijinensis]|uniref:Uncharacterized protein n=1 Tax=Platanthera zijinensis TaxID=2320716 RepID=A0AAP0BHL1_9ASPA
MRRDRDEGFGGGEVRRDRDELRRLRGNPARCRAGGAVERVVVRDGPNGSKNLSNFSILSAKCQKLKFLRCKLSILNFGNAKCQNPVIQKCKASIKFFISNTVKL